MRAPVYFYVTQYHRETRPFAVPVHLVGGQLEGGGEWVTVRPLAGRRAGQTFSIVRNELYRTPGNARLIAGGRAAVAKYGMRELEEAAAARELRKRIGQRRLTERQLRNAISTTVELGARVRRKTLDDRAWTYFDRDLEDWHAGNRTERLIIRMLDMVLGAAERYTPPRVDPRSAAYARAVMLESDANTLVSFAGMLGAPASSAPARLREVVDALEVVEDAWRDAGDEERAERARARREDILSSIKLAYAPRRR